jgi:hypothetical protein
LPETLLESCTEQAQPCSGIENDDLIAGSDFKARSVSP